MHQFFRTLILEGSLTCEACLLRNQEELCWTILLEKFLNEMFPLYDGAEDVEVSQEYLTTSVKVSRSTNPIEHMLFHVWYVGRFSNDHCLFKYRVVYMMLVSPLTFSEIFWHGFPNPVRRIDLDLSEKSESGSHSGNLPRKAPEKELQGVSKKVVTRKLLLLGIKMNLLPKSQVRKRFDFLDTKLEGR